jgi:hypothetical protein
MTGAEYDRLMSKTATHIAQPARHGDWGLTVDKLSQPSEFVVIRYPAQGRRHSEPSTLALRLPYTENADEAIAELVEKAEMPRPTAVSLVMAVSAKLESPKVGDADTAIRPTV